VQRRAGKTWKKNLTDGWLIGALLLALHANAHAGDAVEGLPVYVVQPGDTLAKIALKATGDTLRFRELIQYNSGIIADPNDIEVGMELRLPPGWKIAGAKVPAGERAASPPPPETDRSGLRESPRGAPTTGTFGGKPPPEATLITDAPIAAAPPNANVIDLFTFFPELGRLNDEFDQLMLRAAYAGDITWAAKTHAANREEEKEILEQRIAAAEQGFKMQEARYDACKQAKIAAEALLRKFRFSDSEISDKTNAIWARLNDPLVLEDHLWMDVLWPQLPNEATQIWSDLRADIEASSVSISKEQLERVVSLHESMRPYRVRFAEGYDTRDPETGEAIKVPWTEEESVAISGMRVQSLFAEIQALTGDDAYRKELVESERYEVAMQSIAAEPECKRGLVDAELFLKEQGRKLRTVEEAVSRGDSDSISADAERIARRYQAALGEVQLVDAFISNDVWSDLWWKSGVALRLAGHTAEGSSMIEQAAAVDFDHLLPADDVPPSVQTWFTAAESVVRAKEMGGLDITVHPDMHLTIDGLAQGTEFGNIHIFLKPGIHRVVFWFDGSLPMMKLIGIVEGEDHNLVWYEPGRSLDGEQQDLIGERPFLVAPPDAFIKRWYGGISGVGGATFGRPIGGADLTVRYMPKVIGGQLGGSVFVPEKPLWIGIDEQMDVFARVHGSVVAGKRWDRFGVLGGLGAYVDPLLSAGPLATFELSVRVGGQTRLGLQANVGYDLTRHFDGVPHWTAVGGLGIWL
jgi:hypothetical protein